MKMEIYFYIVHKDSITASVALKKKHPNHF